MILSNNNGTFTPVAGGTGTFIGTTAAFNAVKATLPVNTVAYITDDGNDAGIVPTGLISPFGGSTAPAGWLLCDGSAVSRTTYSGLFAVIGTSFGAGDGSTTFNVPDMRESTVKGVGTTSRTVGAHNAVTLGQFIDDRLQTHTHTLKFHDDYPRGGGGSASYKGYAPDGSLNSSSGVNSGRSGDTTEVKAVGVNFIIKA